MQKICKPNLLELTKFPVEIKIKRVFLRIGALSDRKVGQLVFIQKQEIGRSAACGKDF